MTIGAGVAIQQLTVRGDVMQRNHFLQTLDDQYWPGEDSEALIFIQKIEVQGYWWELAQKISQQARAKALESTSTDTSKSALAVKFNSNIDFVTHAIEQMLLGKCDWYVQAWLQQVNKPATPIALLSNSVLDLPAILVRLQRRGLLSAVLKQFSEQDWRYLKEILQEVCGSAMTYHHESRDTSLSIKPLPLSSVQTQWIQRWCADVIYGIDDFTAKTYALPLVGMLALWKFCPYQLHDATFAQRWHVAVSACAQIGNTGVSPDKNKTERTSGAAYQQELQNTGVGKSKVGESNRTTAKPLALAGAPTAANIDNEGEALSRFLIEQAGLFFLLNYLKTAHHFALVAENVSPWLWVAKTFEYLCMRWNIVIDNTVRELLTELTLEETEIDTETMAALHNSANATAELLHNRLETMQVLGGDWIHIRAKIVVDEVYMRLYFDESSVRTELRLAGLDLNPGWVPWLGRVIHFHYGQFPELRKVENRTVEKSNIENSTAGKQQ